MDILQQIFDLCLVPLLGVITGFLITLIQKKKNELMEKTKDKKAKRYIELLENTIESCVVSINQTYVDELKGKNAFTEEAQKEAFNKCFDNVIKILSKDALAYLEEIHGDLTSFITNKIESEVRFQKVYRSVK